MWRLLLLCDAIGAENENLSLVAVVVEDNKGVGFTNDEDGANASTC